MAFGSGELWRNTVEEKHRLDDPGVTTVLNCLTNVLEAMFGELPTTQANVRILPEDPGYVRSPGK